jgi:CheY-like chemotaxis protein
LRSIKAWPCSDVDAAGMSPVLETILVVDDDAVRNALKFALETKGFRVQLCDGVVDDFELVEWLRHRHIMLPVILISGHVGKQLRRLAQQSGLTRILRILVKPLPDAVLVGNIHGIPGTSA